MRISGRTKIYGIIGDPVEHTLSPTMHNAAFNELELDFICVPFRVKKKELGRAMDSVRCLRIQGLNVTMPHKNAVVQYLDELDSTAKFVRAVNTVLNDSGRLKGFNTDGIGALRALRENGFNPHGKKMLLLGAGGAARAIAFHASQEVEELVILNRTGKEAENSAGDLRKKFNERVIGDSLSAERIKNELKDTDILINATSVGMHPNAGESLVLPEWLRNDLCVMDIVYHPLETKLVEHAKAKGAKIVSGIEMLVYQGAASFEIWTSHPAPIKTMKKAVLNKILEMETIN